MAIYRAGSPKPEVAEWADKRARLQELYKDPDWMLQAGLGDIEHEQYLYDAFKYGPGGENELALKGLRIANEQLGEGRWLDRTPYSEQIYGDLMIPYKFRGAMGPQKYDELLEWRNEVSRKEQELRNYMGESSLPQGRIPYEDYADIDTLGTVSAGYPQGIPWEDRNIGINLNEIQRVSDLVMKHKYQPGINPHEDTRNEGAGNIPPDRTLGNAIADVQGHELGHLIDYEPRKAGSRDNSSVWANMTEYEHPSIFYNTGIYGLDEAHRIIGKERSSYGGRIADDEEDNIKETIKNALFYGGRSPLDERRRYKGDTFYADHPLTMDAQAVAQGYLPNRTIGAVGSQIPFGASASRGKFEGPYGTPNFGSRFKGPYGTPNFREPQPSVPNNRFGVYQLMGQLAGAFGGARRGSGRREPTPNTSGLMQGDVRDTHHFSTGGLVSLVL